MSKFLKVQLNRQQIADIYLEVPDDLEPKAVYNRKWIGVIQKAITRTLCDSDWEEEGIEEIDDVEEVSEDDASWQEVYIVDNIPS